MKQTILAVTALATLSAGLTSPQAQANDAGAAAAGFLGGLFTGLLLAPPPRHAPPAPLVIERHAPPPRALRHPGPRHKAYHRDGWRDYDRRPPRHWRD